MSRTFTVLLVEDDARDAAVLALAFASLGLQQTLQTVPGLDEAIEYLEGRDVYADRTAFPLPGLILVNLGLSRRANFKLLRWLQKQPPLRRIPVVVLAAARQPIGFDQAFDLGATSYLVKPIEMEALRSMIQAVVDFWKLDRRYLDRQKE